MSDENPNAPEPATNEATSASEPATPVAAEQSPAATAGESAPAPTEDATAAPAEAAEEPKPPPTELFHLIVENVDHTSPHLRFRWCLKKEGVDLLREKQGLHPHLLIVIARANNKDAELFYEKYDELDRVLFPLEQAFGTYEFDRPGEFVLFSAIVFCEPSRSQPFRRKDFRKKLYGLLLSRSGRRSFEYSLILEGYEEIALRRFHAFSHLPYVHEVDIKIDESLFAEKPSEREWWWVNLLQDDPPENQCSFRRRRMFAYSLQPILVFLWLVMRSLYLVGFTLFALLMCGCRPLFIRPAVFIHPFDMDIDEFIDGSRSEAFWAIYDEHQHEREGHHALIRMPLVWIGCLAGIFALLHYGHWRILAAGVIGLAAAALIIFLVWMLVFTLRHRREQRLHAESETRQQRYRSEIDLLLRENDTFFSTKLEPITCVTDGPQRVEIEDLPKSHRTLVVRWLDLKSRVCLPFARGR